jgi:2-iminobutanoate/2-iminopropanoate deaminase
VAPPGVPAGLAHRTALALKHWHTGPMAESVGPYTPIVDAGDWLIVSGQVGIADGKLVPGGTEAELRQAISNLGDVLATKGASLADVVKTTVFLRHLGGDYPRMNEVYMELFGDHRPARSAVGVAELPLGALVEVEAWAYIGPR